MDIQNLIRLAHQADLEGNFRVADKLTERAIREAKTRWKLNAEKAGKLFGNQSNKSLRENLFGDVPAASMGPDPKSGVRDLNRSKAGQELDQYFAREKDLTAPLPAQGFVGVNELRRRRDSGERLTPQQYAYIDQIDNRPKRQPRPSANATGTGVGTGGNVGDTTATGIGMGGRGGAGGAGGNATGGNSTSGAAAHGGNATSGSASQANNANNVGVGVNNTSVNQNQNILGGASSYSGGNTMTVNNKMPSNWPGVLAGAAAAGGAGYLGYLIGKDGRPVAPAPNAKPGDFKANQLSERAQAHQMGNAQGAQNFIEARRGNPQFQTAQDFYYAAQAAGMSQSDMNQIAALAKAEGFRDKTPLRN
jgi:hypothetical protein